MPPEKPSQRHPTQQIRCSLRDYPAIKGQNLRGFGWDIDTVYSARGMIFPIGSFGAHRLYRNDALDGPRFRYLRNSARERNPSAG